ncbi:unnamed protein product [Malus baccata var. baccata]
MQEMNEVGNLLHAQNTLLLEKHNYDWLGDIKRASKPKNLNYSKEKVPLPFSNELFDEPLSGNTRALKMQSHEGLTDLYDHLDGFIYAIEGRGNNDTIKCRLFLTTLRGSAQAWFKQIVAGSITSF